MKKLIEYSIKFSTDGIEWKDFYLFPDISYQDESIIDKTIYTYKSFEEFKKDSPIEIDTFLGLPYVHGLGADDFYHFSKHHFPKTLYVKYEYKKVEKEYSFKTLYEVLPHKEMHDYIRDVLYLETK